MFSNAFNLKEYRQEVKEIIKTFEQALFEVLPDNGAELERETLSDFEEDLMERLMKLGLGLLQGFYKQVGTGRTKAGSEDFHYKDLVGLNIESLFGTFEVKRAYFYSKKLKEGHCPIDEKFPLVDKTKTVPFSKVVGILCGTMSYPKVLNLFEKMFKRSLVLRTVEEFTRQLGEDLLADQERGGSSTERIEVEALQEGEMLGLEVDGCRYLDREERWKECKLGAIFKLKQGRNEKGELEWETLEKTYVAGIDSLEDFEERVGVELIRRGYEDTKRMVFLGDGGEWVQNLHERFATSEDEQILDYYHAKEHIYKVGQLFFGEKSKEGEEWAEAYSKKLKEGKITDIVKGIKGLLRRKRNRTLTGKEKKTLEREAKYFRKNRKKMKYKEYREKGLPIGSGIIEGACKSVIGERFKGSGMSWKKKNLRGLLQLRLLYLNDQWEHYFCMKYLKKAG